MFAVKATRQLASQNKACYEFRPSFCLHMYLVNGAWRSLVAHLLWEQGVGGSNPLAPTNI